MKMASFDSMTGPKKPTGSRCQKEMANRELNDRYETTNRDLINRNEKMNRELMRAWNESIESKIPFITRVFDLIFVAVKLRIEYKM